MVSLEILLLGLGLAVDAGVVSFALGLTTLDDPLPKRLGKGIVIALTFGLFQFLMLWGGSYGGYLFTFSTYGYLTQIIVCGIFLVLGIKLFQEAQSEKEHSHRIGVLPVLVLALVTSFDALAAGVSLGALPDAGASASQVGLITFGVCVALYGFTFLLTTLPHRWLLRAGGIIFTGLGLRIVWHYIFSGVA